MALGVTPTVDARHAAGNLSTVKEVELTFTPDTSYPTGGTVGFDVYVQDAIAASDTYVVANGMRILEVAPIRNTTGYILEYDETNDKLLVYVSGGTEVANTTDLSGGGDWTVLVRGVQS